MLFVSLQQPGLALFEGQKLPHPQAVALQAWYVFSSEYVNPSFLHVEERSGHSPPGPLIVHGPHQVLLADEVILHL